MCICTDRAEAPRRNTKALFWLPSVSASLCSFASSPVSLSLKHPPRSSDSDQASRILHWRVPEPSPIIRSVCCSPRLPWLPLAVLARPCHGIRTSCRVLQIPPNSRV